MERNGIRASKKAGHSNLKVKKKFLKHTHITVIRGETPEKYDDSPSTLYPLDKSTSKHREESRRAAASDRKRHKHLPTCYY